MGVETLNIELSRSLITKRYYIVLGWKEVG